MKKPISSWHNTYRKLGFKRIVAKTKQLVRTTRRTKAIEQEPGQFIVETLEPRQMLSSVSLVEGEVSDYSTTLDGANGISQYQVLVNLGDGSTPFIHDDFTVNDGFQPSVEVNNIPIQFDDDGDYEVTISLTGDDSFANSETVDATVANVSPDVRVAFAWRD